MKSAHLILIAFIACNASITTWLYAAHTKNPQSIVKIPLIEHAYSFVCISSKNGIDVTRTTTGQRSTEKSLFVSIRGRHVYLNGKNIKDESFVLCPRDSQFNINGKIYTGPATLSVRPTHIHIVARTTTLYHADEVGNVKKKQEEQKSPKQHIIRVLIGELPFQGNQSGPLWTLKSDAGFIVYDPHKPDKKWSYENTTLAISLSHGSFMINRRPYEEHKLCIIPKSGTAWLNEQQQYQGTFYVMKNQEQILLVNYIDLEEYVYAVLKTESWPGWPIEVNKVFAIASRSYVLAISEQTRSKHLPYHIKNTTEHQTYKGTHHCPVIRTAVEQTRGTILAYQDKPALTMFDACCGGVIPARISNFSFDKAPYLARPYACKHCQRCKIYSWSVGLTPKDVYKKLKTMYQTNEPLETVRIAKKDAAGLVQKLTLQHKSMKKTVTGKQFYNALHGIVKSLCFTLKKQGGTITISGKGLGHHIGLCQWGAREMVRDGWNYKRILSFYYPGAHIVTLV